MSLFSIIEIFIYVLIDFVPNFVLAIIPFWEYRKHSKTVLFLMFLFVYILLAISRILAYTIPGSAVFLTIIWIFLYLFFYRINFSIENTKLLFVLLTVLNYGSFIVIIYIYFTTQIFHEMAETIYSIKTSLVLAVIVGLSWPIMAYMLHKKIKPLMSSGINNKIWRSLWLIPAVFCLSYYYNLYSNGGIYLYASKLNNVLFAVLYNFSGIFVVHLVCSLVNESNNAMQLKAENYKLSLQSMKYENMQNRMEETRRAKHDMRQTFIVIQSFLQNNNIERLKEYVIQYVESLPMDTVITHSQNDALNALLIYYNVLADKNNIKFKVSIDGDYESRKIADADTVILMGNLLENAIEACLKQKKEAYISLHIKNIQDSIIITLDNSYQGTLQKNGNHLVSSKDKHAGIGISSIEKIVGKYNGTVKFDYDDRTFYSSVLLNLNGL